MDLRKNKAVPRRLWEPRLSIKDASGGIYTLTEVETSADRCKGMHFPVEVDWIWLPPDELPQKIYRASWKDSLWWKKTGLTDNVSLRSFSMRLHARMHLLDQEVVLLTQGMIKDTENALLTETSLQEQTEHAEMEMALDALKDIDTLLVLEFDCGGHNLNIAQLAKAAGCPWDAFLEGYMHGRNRALRCTTGGKRRELILAAAKGADGLEQLYQQLVSKIDANELLLFKLVLIATNGITCAAQFAWSDFLVPAMNPPTTTALPTWQQQIADLAGK